jgi:hypothetical protein
MSTPPFDPYREWLGIEPHEQPADFYRLLGVARFETDLSRLAAALDQRMALVRSFQTGPRGIYTQRLLNELSAARIALLSPPSKAAYDAALAQHLAARISPMAHTLPPSAPAGLAVLSFGLGQTAIPPAPPVLPPPPPAAPRVSLQVDAGEELPQEPIRPAPWWRPLMVVIGVPLLVLAAVVGWGVSQPYFAGQAVNSGSEYAGNGDGEAPAPEPPPKPPPKAIVLLQEGSGEVVFSPATAKLTGAVELQVAGTEEVLTNWSTAEDAAEWRFKVVKPGFFQVEIVYATIPEASGAGLELVTGERSKTIDLRASGGLDQFTTDTETVLVSSTAEQTLLIRFVRQPAGPWLVLRSVRFIPPDRRHPAPDEAAPP